MRSVADIFRSYAVFDSEGRHVNGTDKESNHRYGAAYEDILTIQNPAPHSIRGDVLLMMEVGIADGSSLLAWREVFPNALCVGMDIHHSDKAHGERIEFHLGDQCSQADCERAASGRWFDFICEDATHILGNTLLTLYWLWPFVKLGGLYVIEEWDGVGGNRGRIEELFNDAEIIGTCGPNMRDEPLVVLRKST